LFQVIIVELLMIDYWS